MYYSCGDKGKDRKQEWVEKSPGQDLGGPEYGGDVAQLTGYECGPSSPYSCPFLFRERDKQRVFLCKDWLI